MGKFAQENVETFGDMSGGAAVSQEAGGYHAALWLTLSQESGR